MEDQEIDSDQSTYEEEDAYMGDSWSEHEEDYGHGSYQEELEPKPPDSYLHSLNQHKCYELQDEGRGELLYNQPDHPRSSTWSRPPNTSHSLKSVHLYSDAFHPSTPKIQLYAFSGKINYLEWERNMDEWFHYNYIRKEERMKYAVSQLKGKAYKWWIQEVDYLWSYKEQPITTWEHLKKLLRDEFVPRNKTPTTKELPRKKADASTSSKRPSKETSLNDNDKRFVEALTAKMEQLMDAKLNNFRQELQPVREQRNFPRRGREQPRQSLAKTSTQSELSSHPVEPQRRHTQGSKAERVYLEKQVLKALEAVEKSQRKSTTPRPSIKTVATKQEHSHSKEEPVVQRTEINQPLLISQGMNEPSNSTICANEIFRCHGKEKDANAKPMVLEESAKSNTKEEEEISESMQIGDQYETPSAKEELLGVKTPCEVKSILLSSELEIVLKSEYTCEKLTCVEPVQPSISKVLSQVQEESPQEEVQRNFSLIIDLELPTSHEPKTIPKSLSYDSPKQCKETSVFDDKPTLFVLVSTEEEKRFGLKKVKEFCVSKDIFDKMIPTFENFELEKICDAKRFMCSELDSSFKMSDLFRTQTEFAYIRTVSKQWIENVLCVSKPSSDLSEPNLKEHVFENRFQNLVQSNVFASKKKSLIALCSKENLCVDQYLNVILTYDLSNTFYTDIIHLSWSKESDTGLRVFLKYPKKKRRKRRSQRREDDKRFKPPDLDRPKETNKGEEDNRFKPPDLDQDRHQDISFFQLVKEAPPDQRPSLDRFKGKSLSLHISMSTNLFYFHVDCSDLRTNPFEEGGDDMILTSPKKMEHEPEIEPAPNWQVMKDTTNKREANRHKAIQDALLTPRTKELKEAHWRRVPNHRPKGLDHRPQDHPTKVIYFCSFEMVILRSSQGERPEPEPGPEVLIQA